MGKVIRLLTKKWWWRILNNKHSSGYGGYQLVSVCLQGDIKAERRSASKSFLPTCMRICIQNILFHCGETEHFIQRCVHRNNSKTAKYFHTFNIIFIFLVFKRPSDQIWLKNYISMGGSRLIWEVWVTVFYLDMCLWLQFAKLCNPTLKYTFAAFVCLVKCLVSWDWIRDVLIYS